MMRTPTRCRILLGSLLCLLATTGPARAATAAADPEAADLAFLRDLARDVVAASRVEPGRKVGDASTNSCGFTLIMPGGRGGYPAFWIRDFAMSLGSGFITADEMQNHLRLVARCQNGPTARPLSHGLVVPPFAIPDHINFDGGAVFYPGTYSSGDDQGTGAYGVLPPVDDHYEFIHIAWALLQATGRTDFLDESIGGMTLLERLTAAFAAPATDPETGLVVTDEARRAVGFGFCDAIHFTGKILFPSLLRYRAAGQLAEFHQRLNQPERTRHYRTIQQQISEHLAPTFGEPARLKGWLQAATVVGRQADVWGTAYALHLGALRGDAAGRATETLIDAVRRGTITFEGAVRHVPTDGNASTNSAWERTANVPIDSYQNGAYWHTPTGWLISALRQKDPEIALRVFGDYLAHLRQHDFRRGPGKAAPWECFHPKGNTQNGVYMTSVTLPLSVLSPAADDLLIADFEGPDYGAWKTTGEAFGSGPARGTLPGQMQVDGFKGRGLVNSFHQGDGTTGTLNSPEFKLERRFISFLIGGGKDAAKTCLELLIDGRVVRSATGPNDKPGGSEALAPEFWEVGEFVGRTAMLRIVDQATRGWGHLNVDHLVQTDRQPPGLVANAKREFRIGPPYLNLPIKHGGPKRVVTTFVDGRLTVRNDIELADAEPDWWAPMDVGAWRGSTVTLQVDKLPENSTALRRIEPGNSIRGGENLYREPTRGQFHFSPRRGWNNDPNGLVFFNGEYHLFFQHNPYGWGWGNMHWGHAVSPDLVHWQELPEALAPDEFGPMFSGSAVVDRANTSGLGKPGQPAQILLYTAAGDPTVQCLASSTDGRTFTKFPGNPVVSQFTPGNRDPKVLWHEPTGKWVMALYVETNRVHSIFFLDSANLRNWTFLSRVDGFFECPDFFELPLDGDATRRKWVLTAASSEYVVGSFDGTTFTPETAKLPGHRGRGFYAAQTFSDIPASDGRRIQIGWFQTPTPGMPFNQSMTIPLGLDLVGTPAGPRLTWTPVKELASLRATEHVVPPGTLNPDAPNPLAGVKAELVELRAEFEPGDATEVVFTVRGATIRYEARTQELAVNEHRAPAPLRDGRQRLVIYCDRTGLEVFASDGLTYVPMPFIPAADNDAVAVQAKGGSARFASLHVHELRSAWAPR